MPPQKILRNLTVCQNFLNVLIEFNWYNDLFKSVQGGLLSNLTKIQMIHWQKNDVKKSPLPIKSYPMILYAANITDLVQKKAHLKEVMSILKKSLAICLYHWQHQSCTGYENSFTRSRGCRSWWFLKWRPTAEASFLVLFCSYLSNFYPFFFPPRIAAARVERVNKLIDNLSHKLGIFTGSATGPNDPDVSMSWRTICSLEAEWVFYCLLFCCLYLTPLLLGSFFFPKRFEARILRCWTPTNDWIRLCC